MVNYCVSINEGTSDLREAFRLRQTVFRNGSPGLDIDEYDPKCHHFLIHDYHSNELVCVFRTLIVENVVGLKECYSAQFYDLEPLSHCKGKLLEIGRFCVSKRNKDPGILRVAWKSIMEFIAIKKVNTIFGCTSFKGTKPTKHHKAFCFLKDNYISPFKFRPIVNSDRVFEFSRDLGVCQESPEAILQLPPLLRFYLRIGAKVSGSAIFDYDLRTTHVFTLLELNFPKDVTK